MNSEAMFEDTVTFVVRRGKNGYGFTVMGSSPATVRRVDPESTAWQAGLCVDDAVIRINGQNVSRSIADSVAKIVRQSEKQIIMDIQRHYSSEDVTCAGQRSSAVIRAPLSTISEDANVMIPDANKIVCKVDIETPPRNSSSSSSEDGSMDMSHYSSSHDSSRDSSSHDSSRDPLIDLGDWEFPCSTKTSFPSIRINFDELSGSDQDRQDVIRELLSCEEDFIKQMQFGIQRYSNPLRHKFVSPSEHSTLFQDVHKLVSISEYHIYKLKEESISYSDVKDSTHMFIDIVGCIYLPKILTMSETYGNYCNGIKNSFRLLAELRDYQEFNEFLQEPPLDAGQTTISGFIQKPLEHIKNLVLNLQKILSVTALEHQDMDNLSQVIEALRNTCNRINESNTRRSNSMTSLVSRSRSSKRSSPKSTSSRSSEHSTVYTVLSDSSSSSIESSIDTEVLDVQRRLVFCEHVQAFQLATATRHMIYCGNLMHVDGLLCTKLHAVLMSDLLLLTQKQPNHKLLVVDYPILLHDIVQADWTNTETMDFTFGVEPRANTSWVEPRDVTLRAPSLEQKLTWKNILDQRIKSSKLQHERFMMSKQNFV